MSTKPEVKTHAECEELWVDRAMALRLRQPSRDEVHVAVFRFALRYGLEVYETDRMQRRIAQRSPLNTIQEQQIGLPHEEWRILVCCKFLNNTHGRQVRPILGRFFDRAPSPEVFLEWYHSADGDRELLDLIRPLGLAGRRETALLQLTHDYLELPDGWQRDTDCGEWAKSLRSCGQYAADSLDVFRYGRLTNRSSDTWINEYVAWRIAHPIRPDIDPFRDQIGVQPT